MNDAGDTSDSNHDSDRHHRRERWRDAIARTKVKWKKERDSPAPQEFKLSEDVNDFLAAGRKTAPTTGVKPSATIGQPGVAGLPPSDSQHNGQPYSRGLQVPRLDIAQSQRFPNARPFGDDPRWRSDDHLAPNQDNQHIQYERSQSFNSALAKKRTKPRGLSVAFAATAPTIIGEGGDKATAPTCEISKAKHQRSRSLSPYVSRPSSMYSNSSNGQSPIRRKPVPPSPQQLSPEIQSPQQRPERESIIFQPKPFRRVQTGFPIEDQLPPSSINMTSENRGQPVYDDKIYEQHKPQMLPSEDPVMQKGSPQALQTLEQQLRHAFHLGHKDGNDNAFADSKERQYNYPPPLQPSPPQQPVARQPNTLRPVSFSSPSTSEEPSPQSASQVRNHPDILQIRQAPLKPAKNMPNFYAELDRQNHNRPQENKTEPLLHHVRDTVNRLQSLAQSHPEQFRKQGHIYDHRRDESIQERPSNGWI